MSAHNSVNLFLDNKSVKDVYLTSEHNNRLSRDAISSSNLVGRAEHSKKNISNYDEPLGGAVLRPGNENDATRMQRLSFAPGRIEELFNIAVVDPASSTSDNASLVSSNASRRFLDKNAHVFAPVESGNPSRQSSFRKALSTLQSPSGGLNTSGGRKSFAALAHERASVAIQNSSGENKQLLSSNVSPEKGSTLEVSPTSFPSLASPVSPKAQGRSSVNTNSVPHFKLTESSDAQTAALSPSHLIHSTAPSYPNKPVSRPAPLMPNTSPSRRPPTSSSPSRSLPSRTSPSLRNPAAVQLPSRTKSSDADAGAPVMSPHVHRGPGVAFGPLSQFAKNLEKTTRSAAAPTATSPPSILQKPLAGLSTLGSLTKGHPTGCDCVACLDLGEIDRMAIATQSTEAQAKKLDDAEPDLNIVLDVEDAVEERRAIKNLRGSITGDSAAVYDAIPSESEAASSSSSSSSDSEDGKGDKKKRKRSVQHVLRKQKKKAKKAERALKKLKEMLRDEQKRSGKYGLDANFDEKTLGETLAGGMDVKPEPIGDSDRLRVIASKIRKLGADHPSVSHEERLLLRATLPNGDLPPPFPAVQTPIRSLPEMDESAGRLTAEEEGILKTLLSKQGGGSVVADSRPMSPVVAQPLSLMSNPLLGSLGTPTAYGSNPAASAAYFAYRLAAAGLSPSRVRERSMIQAPYGTEFDGGNLLNENEFTDLLMRAGNHTHGGISTVSPALLAANGLSPSLLHSNGLGIRPTSSLSPSNLSKVLNPEAPKQQATRNALIARSLDTFTRMQQLSASQPGQTANQLKEIVWNEFLQSQNSLPSTTQHQQHQSLISSMIAPRAITTTPSLPTAVIQALEAQQQQLNSLMQQQSDLNQLEQVRIHMQSTQQQINLLHSQIGASAGGPLNPLFAQGGSAEVPPMRVHAAGMASTAHAADVFAREAGAPFGSSPYTSTQSFVEAQGNRLVYDVPAGSGLRGYLDEPRREAVTMSFSPPRRREPAVKIYKGKLPFNKGEVIVREGGGEAKPIRGRGQKTAPDIPVKQTALAEARAAKSTSRRNSTISEASSIASKPTIARKSVTAKSAVSSHSDAVATASSARTSVAKTMMGRPSVAKTVASARAISVESYSTIRSSSSDEEEPKPVPQVVLGGGSKAIRGRGGLKKPTEEPSIGKQTVTVESTVAASSYIPTATAAPTFTPIQVSIPPPKESPVSSVREAVAEPVLASSSSSSSSRSSVIANPQTDERAVTLGRKSVVGFSLSGMAVEDDPDEEAEAVMVQAAVIHRISRKFSLSAKEAAAFLALAEQEVDEAGGHSDSDSDASSRSRLENDINRAVNSARGPAAGSVSSTMSSLDAHTAALNVSYNRRKSVKLFREADISKASDVVAQGGNVLEALPPPPKSYETLEQKIARMIAEKRAAAQAAKQQAEGGAVPAEQPAIVPSSSSAEIPTTVSSNLAELSEKDIMLKKQQENEERMKADRELAEKQRQEREEKAAAVKAQQAAAQAEHEAEQKRIEAEVARLRAERQHREVVASGGTLPTLSPEEVEAKRVAEEQAKLDAQEKTKQAALEAKQREEEAELAKRKAIIERMAKEAQAVREAEAARKKEEDDRILAEERAAQEATEKVLEEARLRAAEAAKKDQEEAAALRAQEEAEAAAYQAKLHQERLAREAELAEKRAAFEALERERQEREEAARVELEQALAKKKDEEAEAAKTGGLASKLASFGQQQSSQLPVKLGNPLESDPSRSQIPKLNLDPILSSRPASVHNTQSVASQSSMYSDSHLSLPQGASIPKQASGNFAELSVQDAVSPKAPKPASVASAASARSSIVAAPKVKKEVDPEAVEKFFREFADLEMEHVQGFSAACCMSPLFMQVDADLMVNLVQKKPAALQTHKALVDSVKKRIDTLIELCVPALDLAFFDNCHKLKVCPASKKQVALAVHQLTNPGQAEVVEWDDVIQATRQFDAAGKSYTEERLISIKVTALEGPSLKRTAQKYFFGAGDGLKTLNPFLMKDKNSAAATWAAWCRLMHAKALLFREVLGCRGEDVDF